MRLFLVCFMLCGHIAFSQATLYNDVTGSIDDLLMMKSPQASSFHKFGNVSSIKHRGLIDLNIPLISVKEGEFSESISLTYDSSGFIPSKRDGIVGLNWHLNVGGAITRTVRGVPDEHKGLPAIEGKPLNGFYYGVTRHPMSEYDVYNFASNTGHADADHLWERQPPGTPHSESFESLPDDFSFNFHGISGKFFFNNQGGIEIIPNQPVHIEVDVSHFQEQNLSHKSIPKRSEIIFKVDNGYTYYFGGDQENIEFTINIDNPTEHGNYYPVAAAVINTWYLTKVVAPSGREMIYEYEGTMADSNGNIEDSFTQFFNLSSNHVEFETARQNGLFRPIVLNKQVNQFRTFDEQYINDFWWQDFVFYSGGASGMNPLYEVSKQSYLKSIRTQDFLIEFDYSVKDHLFYNRPNELETDSGDLYNFKDKQLNQIRLSIEDGIAGEISGNFAINTIDFDYEVHSNRNFLMAVQEFGKEPYTMTYNNNNNLPFPDTHGIDHWGFWKGGNSNTSELIPRFLSNKVTGDRNYNHSGTSDYRAPAGNCDVALLNKITYPTSGYSEFIYEPHLYSRRIDRVSAHAFLPSLENVNTDLRAGGARIRTIIDFDGETTTNTRHFYYINNYTPNESAPQYDNTSSGILLDWPRYSYFITFVDGNDPVSIMLRSKSTSFNRNTYDGFHMSYSKVEEVTEDGGYTVSRFSDYETNTDINSPDHYNLLYVDPLIEDVSTYPAIPSDLYRNYIGMQLNDTSIERGKLLYQSHFDNNGNIVLKTEYVYNEDPNRTDNFVTQIHGPGGFWIQATKRYLYTNFLTKERTLTYAQNTSQNALISERRIDYNDQYHKVISEETDVNDAIIQKSYKYPFDLICNTEATSGDAYKYQTMQTANLLDFPVEIVTKRNNHVVSAVVNDYSIVGNQVRLKEVKQFLPTGTNHFYTPIEVDSNCNLNLNASLESKLTVNAFTNFGNIKEYQKENGQPTTLIWGYNDTKILAKIENASASEVETIVVSDPQTSFNVYLHAQLTSTSNEDVETLELGLGWNDQDDHLIALGQLLRSHLPNARISTYTYDPLVGMTSMTDPRGITIYYEYDDLHRLKYVKDKDQNILSEHNYNYKPQN